MAAAGRGALALDPKSVDIRLRIRFVQEKMGMPLDALATYQGTRELADLRGGSEHTADIARCRLAVILGSGGELGHEWCRDDGEGTARARERAAPRAFMTPTLTDLCRKRIEQTRAGNRERLVLLLRGDAADEHRELRLRESSRSRRCASSTSCGPVSTSCRCRIASAT